MSCWWSRWRSVCACLRLRWQASIASLISFSLAVNAPVMASRIFVLDVDHGALVAARDRELTAIYLLVHPRTEFGDKGGLVLIAEGVERHESAQPDAGRNGNGCGNQGESHTTSRHQQCQSVTRGVGLEQLKLLSSRDGVLAEREPRQLLEERSIGNLADRLGNLRVSIHVVDDRHDQLDEKALRPFIYPPGHCRDVRHELTRQ